MKSIQKGTAEPKRLQIVFY